MEFKNIYDYENLLHIYTHAGGYLYFPHGTKTIKCARHYCNENLPAVNVARWCQAV